MDGTRSPRGEPLTILMVEDNLDHAEIAKRNLEHCQVANRLDHVENGEDALDYLYQRGRFADPVRYKRPHLVLLDLRLPRIDGLEVLKIVKGDPELQSIPIVVLTTSEAELDVARAYEYHANSYLTKPVEFGAFASLLRELGYYWLAWNRQPW